jgi:hypothetical protein
MDKLAVETEPQIAADVPLLPRAFPPLRQIHEAKAYISDAEQTTDDT